MDIVKGTRKTNVFMIFAVFVAFIIDDVNGQKMRLEDLQAITLHQDRMAASRRYSKPIPQLVCTGGNAGCISFTPKVVLCKNEGWDGYSIQWECKADMPVGYTFGKLSVICEGYDYPEDPYILKGSCSLEYSLEYSNNEYHYKGKSLKSEKSAYLGLDTDIWLFVILLIIGFGCVYVFLTCSSDKHGDRQQERSRPPDIGWNTQGSTFKESMYGGSSPPPYSEYGGAYNQYGFRSNQAQGGGNGFWTGLGTGGLLGYLFGRRTTEPSTSRTYRQSFDPTDHKYDNSNRMREATGYGSTKRR